MKGPPSSPSPPAAIAVVRVSGSRAGDAITALGGKLPEPRGASRRNPRRAAPLPPPSSVNVRRLFVLAAAHPRLHSASEAGLPSFPLLNGTEREARVAVRRSDDGLVRARCRTALIHERLRLLPRHHQLLDKTQEGDQDCHNGIGVDRAATCAHAQSIHCTIQGHIILPMTSRPIRMMPRHTLGSLA